MDALKAYRHKSALQKMKEYSAKRRQTHRIEIFVSKAIYRHNYREEIRAKKLAHSYEKIVLCPICLILPAISPHHIVPRNQDGSEASINKVMLCEPCHNIVEEYADRGIYYSPELARRIRLIKVV